MKSNIQPVQMSMICPRIRLQLTYVDFMMYELFDVHLVLEPRTFEKFGNLQAYVERFRRLDNISTYMKSDAFMAYPLNGPMAHFGGQ